MFDRQLATSWYLPVGDSSLGQGKLGFFTALTALLVLQVRTQWRVSQAPQRIEFKKLTRCFLQDIVPIAVFITLDIVKTAQAKFIDNDLQMKDSDGGHAEARTSNLNEELGCVRAPSPQHHVYNYIFVDFLLCYIWTLGMLDEMTARYRFNTFSAIKPARSRAIK